MAEKISRTSSGTSKTATANLAPPPPKSSFNWTTFIIVFLAVLALWIMFDPQMRSDFAGAAGAILKPVIGFNDAYPIWTLFCAGVLMTIFSTAVRHIFTNWIEMAKMQKIQGAFNKERMEAYRKGDMAKIKRMQERNLEMMQMSTKSMKSNMKSMGITMFLVIVIFSWLWLFLGALPNQSFAVPWSFDTNYGANPLLLPNWIILYSLISLPIGMVFGRVLKHYSFTKKLAKMDNEAQLRREEKRQAQQEKDREEGDMSKLQDELSGGKDDTNAGRPSG